MPIFRKRFGGKILAIIVLLVSFMTCKPWVLAAGSVTVGGPFTLTAPDGNSVSDQTYRGKWMLVYFGYTSCPDSCPVALVVMATALKKLGPEADKLRAIFITLDPQRDTPEVMEEYTQSFDQRIIGLTGTEPEIDAAAHAYGAYYIRHINGPDAQHYLIDHSTYIYLMNPQGQFIRAFDAGASGDSVAAAVGEEVNPVKQAAQINDGGLN